MTNAKASREDVLHQARMMGTETSVRQHLDNEDAKARGLAAEAVLADANRAEARRVEGRAAWKSVIAKINGRMGTGGKPDDDVQQPMATAWGKVIARMNGNGR